MAPSAHQSITFVLDGQEIKADPGMTIMEAADRAGVYIPRLCFRKGLTAYGSCRVCTVLVNGRPQSACTQPVIPNSLVENDTKELQSQRKTLVEMLFVEGNHFCMFCEKSGDCELQALAYRLGIHAPELPYLHPKRDVDATHPDILIDHNRCILCARCVRASRELDGKSVFHFVGRGSTKRIAVNASEGLGNTDAKATDQALDACPVGALLRKRNAYKVPVGQRRFDRTPIGETPSTSTES